MEMTSEQTSDDTPQSYDISPLVEQTNETIKSWIQSELDISNVENMLDQLRIGPEIGPLYEDVLILHQIMKGFSVSLRNMHDNYVCFQGDRDRAQRIRFRSAAYDRAKESWNTTTFIVPNGISKYILKDVKDKLFQLYDQHNGKILKKELELVEQVVTDITKAYLTTLKSHIKAVDGRGPRVHFEAIHGRMVSQCIGMMGRVLNYSGKLNNVVREATKKMQDSLDEAFRMEMKAVTFSETVKPEVEGNCPIQQYDTQIRKAINVTPTVLKMEHEKIVQNLTKDVPGMKKDELMLRIHSHWMHFVEEQENKMELRSSRKQSANNHLCLYITRQRVWTTVYTPKLECINIHFSKPTPKEPGFPALVGRSRKNGQFLWGYELSNMSDNDKSLELEFYSCLIDFIKTGNLYTAQDQRTMEALLSVIKMSIEKWDKIKIPRLTLIISSYFTYPERKFLRDCSTSAGFKKVVLIEESSLAAYFLLGTLKNSDINLVAVTVTEKAGIKIEIFQGDVDEFSGCVNGVNLLAVTFEKWSKNVSQDAVETVRIAYRRAVEQLPLFKRNCVRHYIHISDCPHRGNGLDEYFRDEVKLRKAGGINGEALPAVFAHFANNPGRVRKFLQCLATVPKSETERIEMTREDEVDGGADNWKRELLRKCDKMEKQLEGGNVAVGRLTTKIIKEAIKRGRIAANEHMIGGAEEKEVEELFQFHKFK